MGTDISQSSLSLAFLAASQAEEALGVMLNFVPQFFNTRSLVMGLQGPSFAYVLADETNNGASTLYFWDGALLKQMTSTADISAAVAAATTAPAAAATATAQAGIATAAASTATTQAGNAATSAGQVAAYVAELPTLVIQQVATYASLPASPVGLYLVLADETKDGTPSLYYFWSTHCMWFAALQVA
ncbi:hypothetical protein [Paraburkholderia sediminicola]|uniref:hypothetical protein n=1 Tax=Paraburkholderia sediminicola TaxID=458836 RepID=UPI0038B9EC27